MVRAYQSDLNLYRKKPDFLLRLPSSGPLEEFYYRKAEEAKGLAPGEKQELNAGANTIWEILSQLDQTGKALETYVRLKDYQGDKLKQSDVLIAKLQSLFRQFRSEKLVFYKKIQRIYIRYQPNLPTDPYLNAAKEMERVLTIQQQLLDSLPYYLDEEGRFNWPVAQVQQSMVSDEKMLPDFGKGMGKISYPASDLIPSFKSAIQAIQDVKRHAVDDHNFAAQQSARHGNEVYLSLMNYYNNDLLATHKSFVSYSQSARQLLNYPAFSPVFAIAPRITPMQAASTTPPFQDKPIVNFSTKRVSSPASAEMLRTLNAYVDFINESLRQMHLIQILLRNYQQSAEYYRDPARGQRRAGLTYGHDDFKVPLSAYQLLKTAGPSVPQTYRAPLSDQAEVLLNMLREMDGLSTELGAYTTQKQYLQDKLLRSDAILDRYAYLFDLFDRKKEQLYNDIRRIHESYPNANPSGSWNVAGNALIKTLDGDKEIMFGIKSFLREETRSLPLTGKLEADARQLVADEYQNMKGLQRYGRSNGLCPYTPYEDLAANSTRFAEKAQKIRSMTSGSTTHPYESFYYFYNNELVYPYNKFVELANSGLLKAVNQPDMFVFRRQLPVKFPDPPKGKPEKEHIENEFIQRPNTEHRNTADLPAKKSDKPVQTEAGNATRLERDTVYVERVRVDTVYLDRTKTEHQVSRSLNGFAANNMVLLLDVSASMDSPLKMPLLKRSIKSLLTLLRAEDQISIVVYSGKARVVLKPTSGSKATEIARMIDLLQSSGDTDGNEGIKLAYKVANKQYLRGGNNRIVLATDGEFPVSDEVLQMIDQNARQDVNLTVFTFGRNQISGKKLRKLSELGQGTYAHVTEESADLQLILEAQAKKQVEK